MLCTNCNFVYQIPAQYAPGLKSPGTARRKPRQAPERSPSRRKIRADKAALSPRRNARLKAAVAVVIGCSFWKFSWRQPILKMSLRTRQVCKNLLVFEAKEPRFTCRQRIWDIQGVERSRVATRSNRDFAIYTRAGLGSNYDCRKYPPSRQCTSVLSWVNVDRISFTLLC